MATVKQILHRKNNNGSYDDIYLQTSADQVKLNDGTTVEATVQDLKTSVSNGKSAVASAITDKGVSTSATATFSTMATNIRAIATGLECYLIINTENGNGSSVTAVQGSTTLTGTVSSEQCILEVPSKGDWVVTVTSPTYGTTQTKTVYHVGDTVETFTMCPQWVLDLKSATVGSTTTRDGYEWILVHKTSTTATLGLRYWYTDTPFGGNITYAGSTIANLCATFESNTLSAETKKWLNNVSVNGVTAKVFIPSYEQVSGSSGIGTLSYYNSNINRIFKDSSGTAKYTWTSSSYNSTYVWIVYQNGTLYNSGSPGYSGGGFRPHMEVNINL